MAAGRHVRLACIVTDNLSVGMFVAYGIRMAAGRHGGLAAETASAAGMQCQAGMQCWAGSSKKTCGRGAAA
jgi:hypothetical protein